MELLLESDPDAPDPFKVVPCIIADDDPCNEPGINALAELHPFPWDDLIKFRAQPDHRYWIDDTRIMPRHLSASLNASVSAIYGYACEPFTQKKSDHNATKSAIRSRADLKRLKPDLFARLDFNKPGCFDALDVSELDVFESVFGPVTKDRVQAEWANASVLGTKLHLEIERWYNGVPQKPGPPTKEFLMFLEFAKLPEHSRAMVHRTEHNIFYAPLRIPGQADVLFKTPLPNVYDIGDWKRVKDFDKPAYFTPEFIQAFPNYGRTKFHMYCLQLNLYKFIYTWMGVVIRYMFMVKLHPNQETYEKRMVPNCAPQVVWLLRKRQERLAAMLCQ